MGLLWEVAVCTSDHLGEDGTKEAALRRHALLSAKISNKTAGTWDSKEPLIKSEVPKKKGAKVP